MTDAPITDTPKDTKSPAPGVMPPDSSTVPTTIPELPVTDADRDRFAEHLWAGTPYVESFSALGGKLTATLRLRAKWELDLVARQMDRDYADGLFVNTERQGDLLNAYNLRLQLVELNGQTLDTNFPRRPADGTKPPTLRQWTQDSVVETLSEAQLFVLVTWLYQFEVKVAGLKHEAVLPNFTAPAAAT